MRNFILEQLNGNTSIGKAIGVPQQLGDLYRLHKGSFEVYKLRSGLLSHVKNSYYKTALIDAIRAGEFNIKLKLLPDVSKFEIKLGCFNPLLAIFGLRTRFGSQKLLLKSRNGRANRYLIYSYHRLYIQRAHPEAYWQTAKRLLRCSHVYMIVCLHYGNKNLYREMRSENMVKLLTRLNRMRGNIIKNKGALKSLIRRSPTNQIKIPDHWIFDFMIDYHRTYIPKGSTYRPLGVPSVAWRIMGSMWLLPLNGFFIISPQQTGFQPHRGTKTAWEIMVKEVINSRNIWEIDFKGYFPSIKPDMVRTAMAHYNLPADINQYLYYSNHSRPINITQFIPDFWAREYNIYKSKHSQPGLFYDRFTTLSYQGLGGFITREEIERLHKKCREHFILPENVFTETYFEMLDLRRSQQYLINGHLVPSALYIPESSHDHPESDLYKAKREGWLSFASDFGRHKGETNSPWNVIMGLPQGYPLSPFLSTVYFEYVWETGVKPHFPNVKYLAYADDMIFYSDDDEEFQRFLEEFPEICKRYRLEISFPKSQIARKGNLTFVETTKFLGIRYNYLKRLIYSDTRSGRTLPFDFHGLVRISRFLSQTGRFTVRTPHGDINIAPAENAWAGLMLYTLATFNRKFNFLELLVLRVYNGFSGRLPEFKRLLRSLERRTTNKFGKTAKESFLLGQLKSLVKGIEFPHIPRTNTEADSFSGVFGGLIQSRLYQGNKTIESFDTPSGSQDFRLKYKTGSIAHQLHSLIPEHLTVFNGSSAGTHYLYHLSQQIVLKTRGKSLKRKPNSGWVSFFEATQFNLRLMS